MFIRIACLWMCVLFYFSFVCLHVCAYAFKFKVHCGSAFEPGVSGLPYYCTPPVCVSAVIGALAVWRPNNKKKSESCTPIFKNTKLLTSFAGSLKVAASVPPYSAYLLLTRASSMNSKLNSPTLSLILHLVYKTMGQRKSGLVGYRMLMTSRSCPLSRASCKPCYMSARSGVFEIVCRSTHRRQRS